MARGGQGGFNRHNQCAQLHSHIILQNTGPSIDGFYHSWDNARLPSIDWAHIELLKISSIGRFDARKAATARRYAHVPTITRTTKQSLRADECDGLQGLLRSGLQLRPRFSESKIPVPVVFI
jgi:hypothetical protein